MSRLLLPFEKSPFEEALELDHQDGLAPCRDFFELPPGIAYFDGNSLGPLSTASRLRLRQVAEQEWGVQLIGAWNGAGWIELAARAGSKIAAIVGAAPDEVLVADGTSVNLFKLLAAALELRPGRRLILCQEEQFPSDLYVADGLARQRGEGFAVKRVKSRDLAAALAGDLGGEVAAICCSQVDFRTGELYDLGALTAAAHAHGALACWDLSHSAGALPVELGAAGADLAVGCGYKFLNGGPGAPAFLYVRRELQEACRNPLQGWLGHRDPFAFGAEYQPAAGIERFACGTPPILSLASLDAALEIFAAADLTMLRRKSFQLGDFFLDLLERRCPGCGFEVVTPREPERRGSQLSLRHPDAFALVQALIAKGVVPDFREPDLLRFGLTPLYQRFADVFTAVETLRTILISGSYRESRFQVRSKVT